MREWHRLADPIARRIAIAATVVVTGEAFDRMTADLPNTPDGMLLYHGGAAFIDTLLFHGTQYLAKSYLRRDLEYIFIASVAANALGWALYMARTPPFLYDNLVLGLNYALAIRLFMGDGNVFNRSYRINWRRCLYRAFCGYRHHPVKKEKR